MVTTFSDTLPEAVTVTQPRRTLWNIGVDLTALDNLLDERGGDVTDPEVCAAVEAWYSELHVERAAKLDRFYGYLKTLEAEANQAREEARYYADKASSREKRIAGLKSMLVAHLQATGGTATSEAGRVFRVQKNGGKLPLILDDNFHVTAPFPFTTLVTKVQTEVVRKALESGEEVPGARLGEPGVQLRIG